MPNNNSSNNRSIKIFLIALVLFALLVCAGCLISSTLVGNFAKYVFTEAQDKSEELKTPIKGYIDAMCSGDVDTAMIYLISQDGSEELLREKLESEISSGPEIYKDYSEISFTSFSIQSDLKATASAEVKGMIEYTENEYREFEACLEKDNGTWRIIQVEISQTVYDSRYGDVDAPDWAQDIWDIFYELFDEFLN